MVDVDEDGPPAVRGRLESAWLTVGLVMAAACVAQAFGRFTWGVVLPGARDDVLGGSNTLASQPASCPASPPASWPPSAPASEPGPASSVTGCEQ